MEEVRMIGIALVKNVFPFLCVAADGSCLFR